MSRRIRHPCAAAALALAAHGCTAEAPRAAGAAVRDSAGITIVESPAALEDRPLAALSDSAPVIDIGTVDGPAEYQLFRVTSAAVLPDGRMAVANGGSQELRFFDSTGAFLGSTGGPGEGPGEYRFPTLVPSPDPDSLVVYDPFARRFSVLAGDGTFVRAATTLQPVRTPVGILADGRVVSTDNSALAGFDSPEGIIPNRVVVAITGIDANVSDTLGIFDGPDLFLSNQDGRLAFTTVPFDVGPTAAAGADRIFVTPGRTPEIREYDGAGALLRIFRVLRDPEPVTRERFDAFVARRVASAGDDNEAAELRRRYRNTPRRETVSAWQRLLVDTDGNVWAERYRDGDTAAPEWTVFDGDGVALGTVTLPARTRLLAVGYGRLVASLRDSLDVEHVVVWRSAR